MLSEPDLRDGIGLLRGGAGFAAAADLGTLTRAIAACDFLGAAVLPAPEPAAAAICARLLLPGAAAAAATAATAAAAARVAAVEAVAEAAANAAEAAANVARAVTEVARASAAAEERGQRGLPSGDSGSGGGHRGLPNGDGADVLWAGTLGCYAI